MRALPLFLLLGLSLAAPLSAQARDEPLGEILESIEDAIRPAPSPAPLPVPHAPVPPDGIGTTPLPPSRIDTPFGPPTEAPDEAEAVKIGRASCRERVCQQRVDLGGLRIIKKKTKRST